MGKKKDKPSKRLLKKQKEVGNPAIIFSFDGTVMDTEPAIFASYRNIFSKFAKERRFTEEEEQKVLGQSAVQMIKEFFPKGDVDEILKEYRLYQTEHLVDLIQPMPGVEPFLKWLKEKGYPVGIISSRSRSMIVNMLEHTGLAPYIDVIIASGSKDHQYTGPESLRRAAKLLKKKCVVYIGHTPAHVMNGHEVGAFTIAYDCNPRLMYEIIDAGPDFVTADYKMIRRLLSGDPLWLAYELIDPPAEEVKEKTA